MCLKDPRPFQPTSTTYYRLTIMDLIMILPFLCQVLLLTTEAQGVPLKRYADLPFLNMAYTKAVIIPEATQIEFPHYASSFLTRRESRRRLPACLVETSLTGACEGVGFAGLVTTIVANLHLCDLLGLPSAVRITSCTPYCGPTNGTNYWASFFRVSLYQEQLLGPGYAKRHGSVCIFHPMLNMGLFEYAFNPLACAVKLRRPITKTTRRAVHGTISRHLRPIPSVEHAVNDFTRKHFHRDCLKVGVHVRATDLLVEMDARRVMELPEWIAKINETISELRRTSENPSKGITLFVASDNHESIQFIEETFSSEDHVWVVSTTAHRAEGHLVPEWDAHLPRFSEDSPLAGHEVLTDILLLSKCDYMIHGESNVAALASYFNPDLKLIYAEIVPKNHTQIYHVGEVLAGEDAPLEDQKQDIEHADTAQSICVQRNAEYSSCRFEPEVVSGENEKNLIALRNIYESVHNSKDSPDFSSPWPGN